MEKRHVFVSPVTTDRMNSYLIFIERLWVQWNNLHKWQ